MYLKWKKGFLISLLVFLALLFLSGCGDQSQQSAGYDGGEKAIAEAPALSGAEYGTRDNSAADYAQEEAEYAQDMAMEEEARSEIPPDRKIIREQYLVQQVQNLEQVVADLHHSLAQISGAYVESLSEWKEEDKARVEHHAQLILRVPIDQFPSFLQFVEKQGNIITRQVTGQDVTEEFVDNQARLKSLRTHEESILKLYEKAEEIEDMLKIEQELSRIRTSIEQIEGRQNYLEQVTSTAKLTLNLYQVEEAEYLASLEDTPLLEEAWLGLTQTLKNLGEVSKRAFVLLITIIPYLILIGALLLIMYLIGKRVRTSKQNQPPTPPTE